MNIGLCEFLDCLQFNFVLVFRLKRNYRSRDLTTSPFPFVSVSKSYQHRDRDNSFRLLQEGEL